MKLKAGTLDNLGDSMVEEMEQVFKETLPLVVPGADTSLGQREREVLFIAVAQGVVRHLRDNPTAFKVEVDSTDSGYEGNVTSIETDPG